MADNNLPSISNHKDDCENEDNIVTMVDVLNAEELLEENADAVLGPGDDKNCTYSEGYLKRQALYACLTCIPAEGTERAGFCLACSYHCHGDHDLVELYTKRNFRCDCGNSLFKGRKCTLEPEKTDVNENSYNDNFKRIYCSCKRPYPDSEDGEDDSMNQCIVCEDWFHGRHLGSPLPNEDGYAEMICAECTDKLPFLQYYLGYAVTKVLKDDEKDECAAESDGSSTMTSSQKQNATSPSPVKEDKTEITEDEKVAECLLKKMKMLPRGSGATYWPEGFRKLLCTCSSCLEQYKSCGVPFITDEEDTILAYEEKRLSHKSSDRVSQYERGMNALSSLDRVQQMEAILNYNDLKSHLSEYLAKFVENKKVVREEDIREFFSGMQARKRQRLDIPHNCR